MFWRVLPYKWGSAPTLSPSPVGDGERDSFLLEKNESRGRKWPHMGLPHPAPPLLAAAMPGITPPPHPCHGLSHTVCVCWGGVCLCFSHTPDRLGGAGVPPHAPGGYCVTMITVPCLAGASIGVTYWPPVPSKRPLIAPLFLADINQAKGWKREEPHF